MISQANKKIVLFFLVLAIIILAGIYVWQGIYQPIDKNSKEEINFLIKKGEGTKEISVNLEKERLIRMATLFRIYTIFKGVSDKLQAGEYLLSPSMTIPEIAGKFFLGDVIEEQITIIEGWDLIDLAEYLEERGFNKDEFLELTKKDFSGDYDFLKDKPKDLSLEGYIFPDTYEMKKGEILEDIINKTLHNFDKKLTQELRQEIKSQNKKIFEIITMASMIEKEVKSLEDKRIVSGILWKRLENNMPLQVDATISYILSDSEKYPQRYFTGKKGVISIGETKIDSPYNTYKYRGLPLGPICNPGIESINAAIYPESSDFWYYLSTPEGETIFSKTLEEHNIAKEKYLKKSEQ
jgi:UPF0755 protein